MTGTRSDDRAPLDGLGPGLQTAAASMGLCQASRASHTDCVYCGSVNFGAVICRCRRPLAGYGPSRGVGRSSRIIHAALSCLPRFSTPCDLPHTRANSVWAISSPKKNGDGVVSPIVIVFCVFSTLGLILIDALCIFGF